MCVYMYVCSRGSHVRAITDTSLRHAVKASQSSFHRCSLHGRVGEYAAIRKEIKSEGKANERPGHARHIKPNGKTCSRSTFAMKFHERSRERRISCGSSAWYVCLLSLSLVTPHKLLSYVISILLTWRDHDERMFHGNALWRIQICFTYLYQINHAFILY